MSPRVVILGGGVGGMSAAHELIERGFEVVVLEKNRIAGGKARSIPVSDDGVGRSGHELADTGVASIEHRLPGEHGFRFFPGFYKHVIDTMRRIPSGKGRTVADHLVPTTRVGITQYGKPAFEIPAMFPRAPADAATLLRDILLAFGPITDLTPDDLAFFGARIWQILTSSPERRLGEYEGLGWWDFVGAQSRSASYQKFLASGITRSLVAAKARSASTRTIGDVFVQLILTIVNPTAGSTDRVFDGPTNVVWIDPWREYLESRGVQYRMGARVEAIRCKSGRIDEIVVEENGSRSSVRGDHYVCALPIERFVPLIDKDLLALDPSLAQLAELSSNVEWMNGIQYYLRRDVPMTHGHVIHIDTQWALTSVSQLQFWRTVGPDQFGDSDVRGVLSVDASDWTAPGSDGRPAQRCSREEVVREVWEQLKRSGVGRAYELRDEDLHSWFLDPDIQPDPKRPGFLRNSEPLLVNLVDTWRLRPEAVTAVPNLFLASDYVRTHTDLATMEGANEAARRAVNGILDAVNDPGSRCDVWPLHEFPFLAPWRAYDAERFKAGQPWDGSLLAIASEALRMASPLLEQARPLLAAVAPFVVPVADALDTKPPAGSPAEELLRDLDPTVPRGSAYVPTPFVPDAMLADAVPGAGDVVGPAGFLDRLGWYRDLLTDTLTGAVPSKEPQRHMYALVRDFLSRSGKGLRPALCIATARALGGRTDAAIPLAGGIEMLHNAFLVHDDVEDQSETRRGVPTMHRRAGVPIAVNAGDAMNALAMRLFRRGAEGLGPQAAWRVLDEVDHMLIESLEGQAMELGWMRDNDCGVGSDEYLRLVLKKTAWYSFIHPMRIGALVARGDDPDLGRFDRFGFLLGAAFQIKDDVLNLAGDETSYGKEINGDLFEGKRTLVLAHALAHASPFERDWVHGFLARPRERRLPREVLQLHEILRRGGSIAWAERSAATLAEAARAEFDTRAFTGASPGPDLEWLRSCADFLVRREH